MPIPANALSADAVWQGPFSATATHNTTGWCSPIPLTLSAIVIAHTLTTDVVQVAGYNSAIPWLGVASASGSMVVYIQTLMADRVTWADYATFFATTTATSQMMGIVSAGNTVVTGMSTNALITGSIRAIPIGSQMRWVFQVNEVAGGPSAFTFTAGMALFG